ncbi:MAG: Ig-like domain-containing protein, partial [Clostridia bacterium]
MRKFIPWLVLLLLLVCLPACAETYVFDNIYGSIDVPEDYIVLTGTNLNTYVDWIAARGSTVDAVTKDFAERGVLMQAWTQEQDACFELTAVQDERALHTFDVNEQSDEWRGSYRVSFYPENQYSATGYDYSTSNWKNTPNGRFLVLRYSKRDNGEIVHRGLMRRTIRNGYEISFDMQVHGRAITNKDNTSLNKLWDSFKFIEIKPLPPAASAKVNITDAPPTETNVQSFDIAGTATEGVKLTAVVMGLSYPEPIVSDVTVSASGKFKLPIKLPKEGVFLITITCENQGEDVMELAYPVTYQHTLLTVNTNAEVPKVISTDEYTISGTSEPGASIQVFINGETVMTKHVTTAGKFKLDLDTSNEGEYEVILAFSKKGLADRRITYTFTRKWTDDDMRKQLAKQAIKPSYTNLVKKMEGYEGRVMGYRAYIVNVM